MVAVTFVSLSFVALSQAASSSATTCGDLKGLYKEKGCCGNPDKEVKQQTIPELKVLAAPQLSSNTNECNGAHNDGLKAAFANAQCFEDNAVVDGIGPQAGADVSTGVQGSMAGHGSSPITDPYWKAGLCPVNVHWHLGAEHKSTGQYDDGGKAPASGRRLASGEVRYGNKCYHYDSSDSRFTTEYNWQHCVGMKVGNTYEVHWPHSKAGACGTPNQYQTPFYDGVFCRYSGTPTGNQVNLGDEAHGGLDGSIGVQGQVFTIVNDDDYYYPDLARGMIVDGDYGADIAAYTGSTTGTSRNNEVCSKYSPITWQIDRKCHLISASSFDKMCADMKAMRDDMGDDLYAHGSRITVDAKLAADNIEAATPR